MQYHTYNPTHCLTGNLDNAGNRNSAMTAIQFSVKYLVGILIGLRIGLSPLVALAGTIDAVPPVKIYHTESGPSFTSLDGDTACAFVIAHAYGSYGRNARYATTSQWGEVCYADLYIYSTPLLNWFAQNWVISTARCPSDSYTQNRDGCSINRPDPPSKQRCDCASSMDGVDRVGDPILIGSGITIAREIDFSTGQANGLLFDRFYRSIPSWKNPGGIVGSTWTNRYTVNIQVLQNSSQTIIAANRPDGRALLFATSEGTWVPDADVQDHLIELKDATSKTIGWNYLNADDDSTENYDLKGKLQSITFRNGQRHALTYSTEATPSQIAPRSGLPIQITDNFGRQLHFTYDTSSRIATMSDPIGNPYRYAYDANGNLITVEYPDGKTRTYIYNESALTSGASLPYVLTGIQDENNGRYLTYAYDNAGLAISTEHAGGVDKFSLSYTIGPNKNIIAASVTDPLGTVRDYGTVVTLGVDRISSVSQSGGAGYGAAARNLTYDANGNLATRTDFNGIVTTYSYDLARNLETSRVEASGTAQARTITTAWHATYRLPLKIAEPRLLTNYTYDTSGNLLNKTVQATSDATGVQGLSPTLVGTAQTWSYTYNNFGQVLTATGPGTDVLDTTSYTYDSSGNLGTITNAAGQVTTLSNYDANGRVGLIADANGATTALTYSLRGWLTSKVVSANNTARTTSYVYDGVGQLTQVTLPNASTISYTYDPAHRLTHIADSLGSSIAYTLDNMGNRIGEQVQDPSGALANQSSRVVDALNRLQQITGAAQ